MNTGNQFENAFNKLLTETMTVDTTLGGADAIFDPDNNQYTSGDHYAPGDSRIPKVIGKVTTRKGETGGKKKKKDQKGEGL